MSGCRVQFRLILLSIAFALVTGCGPKYHYSLENTVVDLGLGVLPEAIAEDEFDPLSVDMVGNFDRSQWLSGVSIPYWQGRYLCELPNTIGMEVHYINSVGTARNLRRCYGTETSSYVLWPAALPIPYSDDPPIYLTDEYVTHYTAWRNRFGRPLTMFSLGPDRSLEAKVKYSIRLSIGHLFERDPLEKAFDDEFPGLDIKGWLVRNLSEYAVREASTWTLSRYSVAELFAWYTAPWYQKGSLPRRIESALEDMAQFKVGSRWRSYAGPGGWRKTWKHDLAEAPFFEDLKATLAQARSADPCNCYPESPLPAADDKMFIYLYRWENQFHMPWVTYDFDAVPRDEYPKFYDYN